MSNLKRAVVLVNLGTPDSPAVADVRSYLRQFLMDKRIVGAPRALWWPFLHLVLLPAYAPRSAARYASVWTPDGSPQRVHTQRQTQLLQQRVGQSVVVRHAMRYGQPSLSAVLDELLTAGATDIVVVPAFPQYSTTTTGSIQDALDGFGVPGGRRVSLIDRWGSAPGYIEACAGRVSDFWAAHGKPDFAAGDRLLLSFHGVPRSHAGSYPSECEATAALLRERLQLTAAEAPLTYQSKFGRGKWLEPATISTVRCLSASASRVDVFCPGFIADCLETVEEIGRQNRQAFLGAGGREFNLIESVNDRPELIEALAALATPTG